MKRSIGDRAANGDSCNRIVANSTAEDFSHGKGSAELSLDLKVARVAAFFNGQLLDVDFDDLDDGAERTVAPAPKPAPYVHPFQKAKDFDRWSRGAGELPLFFAGIYSAADLQALSDRAGLPGRTAWTWRELDFLLRGRIEQRFGPRRIPSWEQLLTETGKDVLAEGW